MTARGGLRSIVQRLIENLSQPGDTSDNKLMLVRQLRSSNNWTALRAVDRLRAIGALEDGSLQEARLMNANLANADLHRANLTQANLQECDLSGANLQEARMPGVVLMAAELARASLFRADLSSANLFRAKLSEANLQETFLFQVDMRGSDVKEAAMKGARLSSARLDGSNITLLQLAVVGMLNGTIMPDATRYDGRFNLPGDIQFAQFLDMELDASDPAAMADFYEVPLGDYMRGQVWAQDFLPRLRAHS